MGEKTIPKSLRPVLCFVLGVFMCAFHSCKKEQTLEERPNLPGTFASDNSPTWSANGSKIIFDTNRDGNWEIYSMKADGTDQTRITDSPAQDRRPSWSPDGKNFTFTYGFDDESKPRGKREPWSHICICDLSIGKWTQITHDGIFNREPDWIPVQEEK